MIRRKYKNILIYFPTKPGNMTMKFLMAFPHKGLNIYNIHLFTVSCRRFDTHGYVSNLNIIPKVAFIADLYSKQAY